MDNLTPCPPWLLEDMSQLLNRSSRGRLPHALLLTGIDGIGKRAFSQCLAETLLCQKPSPKGACGVCEPCRQLLADSHPDYRKLLPEGANAAIKVDPVRALVEWLQLTASQGSYRVALLEQADTLNRNAANSLLKTLEEPADHAVLILSATRTGALPATIRSRCQKVTLKMTDQAAAIEWLGGKVDDPVLALLEASGGPYLALANASEEHTVSKELLLRAWHDLFLHKGSVGRISDSLSNLETSLCLATFSRWCLIASKQREKLDVGVNPAVKQVISETQDRLNIEQWFTLYDRLLRLYRSDSASFKTQTVLEGLFADIRLMTNG
ncbi:MAG: DNA polymerase-3 subunit delta' [Porticoccaceae bacterium]